MAQMNLSDVKLLISEKLDLPNDATSVEVVLTSPDTIKVMNISLRQLTKRDMLLDIFSFGRRILTISVKVAI